MASIDKVDPVVVDSVASANFKTLGDGPAFYTGLAHGNAVSHQNRLQQLAESSLARMQILAETAVASAIRSVAVTPQEEAGADATEKHSDLAALVSSILGALASGQQAAKVAQSTSPETAKSADLSELVSLLKAVLAK